MRGSRLCLAVLLCAAAPAYAQQTDEQLWLAANGTTSLGGNARITVETVARFSDDAGGFFHDEIGGMLAVDAAKGLELAAGYRHVDDYDHGRRKPNEERLRQQASWSFAPNMFVRLRAEERFHSAGSDVGLRLRPLVRLGFPAGGKGVLLFVSHEDFLNLNTTGWGQRRGHERMRNAAGVSIPLSGKLRGDLGYLNQYRFGRGGARDVMEHAATFTLSLTL